MKTKYQDLKNYTILGGCSYGIDHIFAKNEQIMIHLVSIERQYVAL